MEDFRHSILGYLRGQGMRTPHMCTLLACGLCTSEADTTEELAWQSRFLPIGSPANQAGVRASDLRGPGRPHAQAPASPAVLKEGWAEKKRGMSMEFDRVYLKVTEAVLVVTLRATLGPRTLWSTLHQVHKSRFS